MRAKKKLTKLWSILLVIVMLVGLLPTTALAATDPATATADFKTDPTAALSLLGSGADWNTTTSTLTLNNVNFETSAATAVKLPADATIDLIGDNTITGGNASSGASYGIYAEGNLTIEGSGTLNVTAGNASSRSCGIYAVNGKVLIKNGTVNANGGTAGGASFGIYSNLNGASNRVSCIIEISGGTVIATGGTATGDGSFGINAEGEVIISGGEVKATGGTGRGSDGIYSGSHKVTINGGTVMAIGGAAPIEGWSVGIYANNPYDASVGKVTINGGTVTSAANYNSSACYPFKGNVTGSGYKTISFNKNGGLGEMIAYTYADSYTLPANGFTPPADKQFMGWSESLTGEVIETPAIDATDGKTLYAIWKNNAADFTVGNGTAALALLNAAKTGTTDSTWDSDTKTLTLNGVNFTTTAAIAVKLPANATIVLHGVNTIKGGNSDSGDCYGIDALGNLTIQGTGTLNVTGGTATNSDSFGIYANNDLTISGGTVTARGGAATGSGGKSYGIFAGDDVTISGDAAVTATGGAAKYSYGICAYDNVIIEGGIVSAKGGTATDGYSYGIRTIDLHIKISGGTVTAEGGAADYSYGTRSDDDTYISGGTITGTGGAADIKSYGIRTADYIYVSGGTATGLGGTAAEGSYGFYAYNHDVNISGGTVTAEGGAAANGSSLGIYADEDIIISDGTVTATGKSDAIKAKQGLTTDGVKAIQFNGNSGTGAMQAYTNAATYTLPANGFTAPDGKQFNSWKVGSENKVVGDSITVSENITVTALWKADEYNVTVTGGKATVGASTDAISKAEVGATVTLTANKAPDGKVFDKWVVNGVVVADANSATTTFVMSAGNVTAEATYKNIPVVTYKVTFEANGGSVTPTTATTAADGKLTSLPTPARSGYTFNGWYTEDGTKVDTAYAFNADTTIYAQWTSIPIPTPIYTPPTYQVESVVSKDADGSVSFSQNSAKKGDAVTITVIPDRYYKVDGVTVKDASGKEIAVTDNGDGTFTFQMPDSKVTVEPAFSWDNPFVDVAENDYFAPAVEWALKNSVTDGTGDGTTFSPNAPCTRAQAVTFLWRAAGCPEPESSVNPFTDVEKDAYYAKAVLWAVENGITDGTSATAFSPDETCSRGQIVTFLWRAEKSPAAGAANPFTDVETDAYYAGATNWAVENGITEGTGDGTTFSPANDCDRAQIVTFLYRFFAK